MEGTPKLTLTIEGGPDLIAAVVASLPRGGSPAPTTSDDNAVDALRPTIEDLLRSITPGAREVLREMAVMTLEADDHEAGSIELRRRLGDIGPSALAGRLASPSAWTRRRKDKFKPFSQRWDSVQNWYYMEVSVAQTIVEVAGS
jgi:hypothetical protein